MTAIVTRCCGTRRARALKMRRSVFGAAAEHAHSGAGGVTRPARPGEPGQIVGEGFREPGRSGGGPSGWS